MHIGAPAVIKQFLERLFACKTFVSVKIKLIRGVAVQIKREETCENFKKKNHTVQNKIQLTELEHKQTAA